MMHILLYFFLLLVDFLTGVTGVPARLLTNRLLNSSMLITGLPLLAASCSRMSFSVIREYSSVVIILAIFIPSCYQFGIPRFVFWVLLDIVSALRSSSVT